LKRGKRDHCRWSKGKARKTRRRGRIRTKTKGGRGEKWGGSEGEKKVLYENRGTKRKAAPPVSQLARSKRGQQMKSMSGKKRWYLKENQGGGIGLLIPSSQARLTKARRRGKNSERE